MFLCIIVSYRVFLSSLQHLRTKLSMSGIFTFRIGFQTRRDFRVQIGIILYYMITDISPSLRLSVWAITTPQGNNDPFKVSYSSYRLSRNFW